MTILHQIDPIAFRLGPLQVHWYGIMYLLGFGLAWWLGLRRVRAGRLPGVNEQAYGDLLFYAMLGVVLGGRLGYVFFYSFGELLKDPLMLFRIWEGGMSFHGGLLGVVAAAWWWSRRHRLHLMDTVDFLAPLVPPGLGFGRLGNYIGVAETAENQFGKVMSIPDEPMEQYFTLLTNLSGDAIKAALAPGANPRDSKEILGKASSLKGVLEPFSTRGNLDMLQRAGFVDVMTIFKHVCFEGFLAIK